jgi:transketolase
MRFGRAAVPIINDRPDYRFEVGRGVTLADGKDVTLIATGLMVHLALEAKTVLAEQGIDARVVNIHTIKPLDDDLVTRCARETGALVTAEEHSIVGGLGGAVCECVSGSYPVPVVRVGVEDTYGRSGTVQALLSHFGLTVEHIVEAAKHAVELKK